MDVTLICVDCGAILTEDERCYYDRRCENCERSAHDELVAWREGADNAEMDAAYGQAGEVMQ